MTRCGPGLNPCSSALVLPSSAGGRMVGGGPTHDGGGPFMPAVATRGEAGPSFLSHDLSPQTLSLLSCSCSFLRGRVPHKFTAGGSSWGCVTAVSPGMSGAHCGQLAPSLLTWWRPVVIHQSYKLDKAGSHKHRTYSKHSIF